MKMGGGGGSLFLWKPAAFRERRGRKQLLLHLEVRFLRTNMTNVEVGQLEKHAPEAIVRGGFLIPRLHRLLQMFDAFKCGAEVGAERGSTCCFTVCCL